MKIQLWVFIVSFLSSPFIPCAQAAPHYEEIPQEDPDIVEVEETDSFVEASKEKSSRWGVFGRKTSKISPVDPGVSSVLVEKKRVESERQEKLSRVFAELQEEARSLRGTHYGERLFQKESLHQYSFSYCNILSLSVAYYYRKGSYSNRGGDFNFILGVDANLFSPDLSLEDRKKQVAEAIQVGRPLVVVSSELLEKRIEQDKDWPSGKGAKFLTDESLLLKKLPGKSNAIALGRRLHHYYSDHDLFVTHIWVASTNELVSASEIEFSLGVFAFNSPSRSLFSLENLVLVATSLDSLPNGAL